MEVAIGSTCAAQESRTPLGLSPICNEASRQVGCRNNFNERHFCQRPGATDSLAAKGQWASHLGQRLGETGSHRVVGRLFSNRSAVRRWTSF